MYRQSPQQGDPLSSLFFILFINDIASFMAANGALGLNMGTVGEGEEETILNLLALFFADDTTLIARTAADATRQLDLLSAYASANGLEINVEKTEWMAM